MIHPTPSCHLPWLQTAQTLLFPAKVLSLESKPMSLGVYAQPTADMVRPPSFKAGSTLWPHLSFMTVSGVSLALQSFAGNPTLSRFFLLFLPPTLSPFFGIFLSLSKNHLCSKLCFSKLRLKTQKSKTHSIFSTA